jgi:hypothetical protein
MPYSSFYGALFGLGNRPLEHCCPPTSINPNPESASVHNAN